MFWAIMENLVHALAAIWATTADMGPYLLLGFLIAGVLSVTLSPAWVERHLGGRGFWPSVKAAALGVPLPLCSCGVIPVAASIRRHGAGRGATASFLLSTPQTGVDSIFATYALLGWVYAIIRPVVALVSGILGGTLIDLLDPEPPSTPRANNHNANAPTAARPSLGQRGVEALKYALVTLPNDIAKPLILGVIIAGLIAAFAPADALKPWLGGSVLSYLIMMALGIPLYVCSTGSIPLAMSFMHLGASPGAALVFLITGPATNAAALTVYWTLLGKRFTVIYLAVVALSGLVAGVGLDLAKAHLGLTLPGMKHMDHVMEPGVIGNLWAGALTLVLIASMLISRWPGKGVTACCQSCPSDIPGSTKGDSTMTGANNTATLQIKGMTCSHCTGSVKRALIETPGVRDAQVDLATGRAVVTGDSLDGPALVRTVKSLGYEATLL